MITFTYHVTYGAGWTTITKEEAREIIEGFYENPKAFPNSINTALSAAEHGDFISLKANGREATIRARISRTEETHK